MAVDQRSLPLGQRTDALRARIDARREREQRLAQRMAPEVPVEVVRARRVWDRYRERVAALQAEQAEARRQRDLEDLVGWMDD
jgi:hypothetical protein